MAGKKKSGSKQPARKRKVNLKDLSSPGQELSEGQAKAVKGGRVNKISKQDKDKLEPYLQTELENTIVANY